MASSRIKTRVQSWLVTSRQWAKVHPVILVLPMAGLVAALFWFVQTRSYNERQASTPHDLTVAIDGVRERLDAGLEYLYLLAEDKSAGTLTEETFHLRASVFVREHPDILTIAFADPASVYRWVAPYEDNKQIVGINLNSRADKRAAREAMEAARARFTPAYLHPRGIKGVAVFVPVFRGEQFLGTFSCVFVLDRLLSASIPRWLMDRYEVSFIRKTGEVLSRLTDGRRLDNRLVGSGVLNVEDLDLALRIVRYTEGVDWEMAVFVALIATMTVAIAMVVMGLNRDNQRRRKIADEYRRAKDLAESANQSKSQFIANVSHEIRTPIGAIMGYSELILRPTTTAAEVHESGVAIRRNAANLLDIINDLLDLSKVESGLMEIEKRRIPLAELISEVIAAVKPQADAKGLELRVEQGGLIPETVTTDPLRLRQILINIIGNAIKFTASGEVVLKLMLSLPAEPGANATFELAVSDTGIGISEQQASNLFRPFMQGDKFIARKFGGSGLGLALSKQLAQLLGGDLALTRSTVGAGSTFTIAIEPGPLRGVKLTDEIIPIGEPQGDIRKPGKRLIGARVLLVEDGLDNQIIFKEFLRSEGAEVAGAEDGYKAVDVCRSGRDFDVILMDIQMPGMDGYQTTRELRAMGIHRPIVALTAHAMKGERERCIEAGCDDFLTKPVSIDKLVSVVAKYWGGRSMTVTPPAAVNADEPAPGVVAAAKAAPVARAAGSKLEPLVSTLASDPRVTRVLGGFLERLPARIDKMHAAADGLRWDELARDVHSLKGTAGNYGYPDMVNESRLVEELIKASHSESEIKAALTRLSGLCERARLAAVKLQTS